MKVPKEQVLEAIEDSTKKYIEIKNGAIDHGTLDCPLCALFFGEACQECPIREKTGHMECSYTPYEKWIIHLINSHKKYIRERKIVCPECEKLIDEEINFLQELRDEYYGLYFKKKYYIAIKNPNTAIGEAPIIINVVDEKGNNVSYGNIISFTKTSGVFRYGSINNKIGLLLNSNGAIELI